MGGVQSVVLLAKGNKIAGSWEVLAGYWLPFLSGRPERAERSLSVMATVTIYFVPSISFTHASGFT